MEYFQSTTPTLLSDASERAVRYLESLDSRAVAPDTAAKEGLSALGGSFPDTPSSPTDVIELLDRVGSPATMATAGPRFFGYVVGGSLPVALAANWIAGAWDQNAPVYHLSPTGVACEQIVIGWLIDLLGLPQGTWGGLVTGATAANFTGLAAARYATFQRFGWNLTELGMAGAPRINVIVSEEAHVSLLLALRTLGFGTDQLIRVPTDDQGRMQPDALPDLDSPVILCMQAGNVNSGAFDPAREICEYAKGKDAWVHIDGAFGLWAEVSPRLRHLTEGIALADSWALDGHKWLNVPYDCGFALCRDSKSLAAAMSLDPAGYLAYQDEQADPHHFSLEMSRRARGVDAWAALRCLGRQGLVDLVERTCKLAERFAERLSLAGYEILNEVVINQVLVSFGNDEQTQAVIDAVQEEGTCWMGGTSWHGRKAMRISVSSWATTEEDVERSMEAILKVAGQVT